MRVLSIETSCDETAAAIVEWTDNKASVLANTVSSQIALHAKWGGVVPALASREHMKNIVPVIEETLATAKMSKDDIDLIAVTEGPGLMPALIVGVSAAKTLALTWKKPLIGIQHLEGHIYANFLSSQISNQAQKSKIINPKSEDIFPLLALIVSGGHTQLVLMQKHFDYTILGETQDDAAGEAFDKVAKLLGLTYPGGPVVAKRADAFRQATSDPPRLAELHRREVGKQQVTSSLFPRPMINSDDFDFSFSGLKTAVLYFLKKHPEEMKEEHFIDMVCHEFQEAVVDVLVAKTKKALALYSPQTLVIAGGVSANVRLREQLTTLVRDEFPQTTFLTPEFTYSLDNAAMIGIAALLRYERMTPEQKEVLFSTPLIMDPDANLPLQNL